MLVGWLLVASFRRAAMPADYSRFSCSSKRRSWVDRHGHRAEVSQANQWFGACVFDFDAARGCFMRNEHFVFGVLAKIDHGWSLQRHLADPAFTLHGDPTAGTGSFSVHFTPGSMVSSLALNSWAPSIEP